MGKRVIPMARQVDTSEVFKGAMKLFISLRAIAEDEKLKCPVCRTDINLSDDGYKFLVANVRDTIRSISQLSAA
jgi:hypothetical protein